MSLVFPGSRFVRSDVVNKNFKVGSTKHRLSVFRFVTSSLRGKRVTASNLNDIFDILSKVGSVSKWGNVYLVCIRGPRGCREKVPFALKIQNPRNMRTKACEPLKGNELGTELFFLRMSNYLVAWNLCVNFPLTPQIFILPKKKLVITSERQRNYTIASKDCDLVGILTEWANLGDLGKWSEKGIVFDEGIQLIVQVFMSLYTLNYLIGYHHNDLHQGNILMSSLSSPKTFLYRVYYGTKPIDIRIHGCKFLAKLWDFSYANLKPIHLLPAFRNQNIEWKSDAERLLVVLKNQRFRTIHGVVDHLRNMHHGAKNFVEFFNYAMYFLADQSPSVTIDERPRTYKGDRTAILSVMKPLTKRQKNIIFKRKRKSTIKKRLQRLFS